MSNLPPPLDERLFARPPLPPPDPALEASVVLHLPDRAEFPIARSLQALADQEGVGWESFEVLLVLEGVTAQTEEGLRAVLTARPELRLYTLHSAGRGAAHARHLGMEAACARLLSIARPLGLVAATDTASAVDRTWLRAQLDAAAAGARAIGAAASDSRSASIALTAEACEEVGGLHPPRPDEDLGWLERALKAHDVAIRQLESVRVERLEGEGVVRLAPELALDDWLTRRSYRGDAYAVGPLLDLKQATVSVVLPARLVAGTIGTVVSTLAPLAEVGLIDELVVVDAASSDGTAEIARSLGAIVHQESALLADHGPARGKGDAMWRGLSATTGDIVLYLDTDTEDFCDLFLLGLLGPLLEDPGLQLVKGSFARPFRAGDRVEAHGGGRVTELAARPLLNLYVPELAGFEQPLAGEIGARRSLLEQLAFPVGYGVEIAMMIDAVRLVGIDAMGQVDLGTRQNRHQPLRDLSAMAYAVQVAAARRVHGVEEIDRLGPGPLMLPGGPAGLELRQVAVEERPSLASLRAAL